MVLPQRASPWLLFFTALEAHHEGWVCVDGVPTQTWPILSTLSQWDHGSHIRKTKGLRCGMGGGKERLLAFPEPGTLPAWGAFIFLSSLKRFSPDTVMVPSLTASALCSSVTAWRGPQWLFHLNRPFPARWFPVPFALLHGTMVCLFVRISACYPPRPPPPAPSAHVSASWREDFTCFVYHLPSVPLTLSYQTHSRYSGNGHVGERMKPVSTALMLCACYLTQYSEEFLGGRFLLLTHEWLN